MAPQLGRPATERSFAKALFQADANMVPDPDAGILHVQLPPLATTAEDAAAAALCADLNARRAIFPGSRMRLEYEFLSAHPAVAPGAGVAG